LSRQRIHALRAIIQAQLIVFHVLQLWLLLVLLGNQSVSISRAYSAGGCFRNGFREHWAEAAAIFEVRPDPGRITGPSQGKDRSGDHFVGVNKMVRGRYQKCGKPRESRLYRPLLSTAIDPGKAVVDK
jgi:hypothetical protein